MQKKLCEMQLGKNRITENFIENLKNHFKKHDNVKISVLKSCCRNKADIKKMAEEILKKLGKNYTAKTIGFTIALKKWRKVIR